MLIIFMNTVSRSQAPKEYNGKQLQAAARAVFHVSQTFFFCIIMVLLRSRSRITLSEGIYREKKAKKLS